MRLILALCLSGCAHFDLAPREAECWQSCRSEYGKSTTGSSYNYQTGHCYCRRTDKPKEENGE